MTKTMPMLTDSERDEEINACISAIQLLEDDLSRNEGHPAIISDLRRQRIALAALTAKPIDFLGIGDDDAEYNGIRHFSFKPKEIIDLYRAPPVPALKSIDLTPLDRLAGNFLQASVDRGGRVSSAYAECAHSLATEVKNIRSAGYEVKK